MTETKPKARSSNISRRRKAALDEGTADYLGKRDELIRIAAGIFKAKGYNATTFGDIATHTGLDRATLYYYFGSKEEIFQGAIQGALDKNLEAMRSIDADPNLTTIEKLSAAVRTLMASYHEHYPYLYVYLQQDIATILDRDSKWARDVEDQVRVIETAFARMIESAINQGHFRSDIPPVLSINSIFGMLNWTHRWYDPEGRFTPDQISDAFVKIFFDGMKLR